MRELVPGALLLLLGSSPPPSPDLRPCTLASGAAGYSVKSSIGRLTLCIPSRFEGGRLDEMDMWVDSTVPPGIVRPSIELSETAFEDSAAAGWANAAQGTFVLSDSSGVEHVGCFDCPIYKVNRVYLDTLDGKVVRIEQGTLSGLFVHYHNATVLRATWPPGAAAGVLMEFREPAPGGFPEMRDVLESVRWWGR